MQVIYFRKFIYFHYNSLNINYLFEYVLFYKRGAQFVILSLQLNSKRSIFLTLTAVYIKFHPIFPEHFVTY